ncbi:MAG: RiPP maturation radical SAM C-methyltransferase [Bacillota bacterium]
MNNQLHWEATDVCLVSMPYSNPQIPSLALGLLQATLVKEEIDARSIYANLLFNEQIGMEKYNKSHYADPLIPIAEWTFASSAFTNFKSNDDLILKEIYKKISKRNNIKFGDFYNEMLFVKHEAEKFITKLAKKILKMSPRVVACSSSLAQKVPSLALLRKIKMLNPNVITLMGGADCESIMGRGIHKCFTWVDYVITGEGEDIIVPLVNKIFKFGCDVPTESLEKGIFAPIHREIGYPSKKQIENGNYRALAKSFVKQIIPIYDDYFKTLKSLPELSTRVRPSLPIQSSRGCWYGKCKFCGLNAPQTSYRSRPYDKILAELDELSTRYGVKHFEFLDNILDMKYFDNLIPELIKRKAPYKLFFEIRSSLSKKQFKMIKDAGVIMCQPGIESLHSSALKEIRKGVKAWQNIQTLKWGRQFGIHIYWSILHTFPFEKDEWYKEVSELIPLITHLYPPSGTGNIEYQRNSHYFNHKDKYNLKLTNLPLYSYIYPLNNKEIKEISFSFEDEFYSLLRNDKRMSVLFRRPGLYKVGSALIEWKELVKSDKKPKLVMEVKKEKIIIEDTRPISVASKFELRGIQKEIYLECDQAIKEKDLRKNYIDNGYSVSELNKAIDFLVNNKLLLCIDKRLLSLAIEKPYSKYSLPKENPMGWITIN